MNGKRLVSAIAVPGLMAVGVTAMSHDAKARWMGIEIWVPPVVVAPPVYAPLVYANPPVADVAPPAAYYPTPRRVWVPPRWEEPYRVRGHTAVG